MSDRHFLFLQGMPCSFFRRLGKQLLGQGHRVTRINLSLGDWLFWHGAGTLGYRGNYAAWPAFIDEFLRRNKITDLVLLGEQRKYHKEAVYAARKLGIRVMVTDFGYFRLDWIALERDGMGGNSHFPRDPTLIMKNAASVPVADFRRLFSDSAARMALGDLLYSFSNVFFGIFFFPFYRRSEARPHPLIYFPAIGWRLLLAGRRARQAEIRIRQIFSEGKPFFLLPLQLEHDFQIIAYSPFSGSTEVIETVIRSFAAHARAGCSLLLKSHPWEPGLRNWRKIVAEMATKYGVMDRVIYLEGGNLDAMIGKASGVVTVNSTSGLRALQLDCPVQVLGRAIYDVPGVTCQRGLDAFWDLPSPPESELRDAMVKLLAATVQIRGVFFNEPGATLAIRASVDRLVAAAEN